MSVVSMWCIAQKWVYCKIFIELIGVCMCVFACGSVNGGSEASVTYYPSNSFTPMGEKPFFLNLVVWAWIFLYLLLVGRSMERWWAALMTLCHAFCSFLWHPSYHDVMHYIRSSPQEAEDRCALLVMWKHCGPGEVLSNNNPQELSISLLCACLSSLEINPMTVVSSAYLIMPLVSWMGWQTWSNRRGAQHTSLGHASV